MSTLNAYRSLFALAGPGYVLTSFLARLPLAMSQLGVLLLVTGLTGSYGAGGASAGALAVAGGLGAPLWGALADRRGQRGVLLVQCLGGAAGFVAILLVAHSGAAWPVTAAVCAVAGFMLPQVGPMSRVRWRPLTSGQSQQERLVGTAFSFEGAADESAFVFGPALVGLAVALASPSVALAAAAVVLAVFGCAFAVHRSATPGHVRDAAEHADAGPLLSWPIVVLFGSQLAIGTVFGSVQTGTSVLATEAGSPGMTGFLHALLGVGSVAAGLAVPALPARFALSARLRVFAVALLLFAAPLLLVDSLSSLVVVLLVLGVSIAPYMITTFTLAEQITPVWRTSTVMTLLAAATVLGYALGASLAGQLADRAEQTGAFAVTVGAALTAFLVSTLGGGALRRAQPTRG